MGRELPRHIVWLLRLRFFNQSSASEEIALPDGCGGRR
jgi:hypothetical protein